MWLTVSFFYAFQYILRVLPGILMDDAMVRFSPDAMLFGQFSGVYYIGYALAHLPIGIILDRHGPKKIIPVCVLLSVAGTLPFIFATRWAWPILGRALTGVGSSAAILGAFKVIRMAFDERRFARMLSLTTSIGLMGAIYGGAPVRQLHATFGYRPIVIGLVAIGVVLAGLCYLTIPAMAGNGGHTENNLGMFASIGKVLATSRVVLLSLFAGLMVGPLEGFADSWGPKFLTRVHGISPARASFFSSLIFVGMCFGGPVLSFISERSRCYFGTITASGVWMFVALAAIVFFTRIPEPAIVGGFLLVGLCSAYQILVIYKISTFVSNEITGLATAMANMIIMLFGYGFHGMIGFVVRSYGRLGGEFSMRCGLAVIPIALILGSLGCYLVGKASKEA
jgi:MFS family permease